MPLEIQEREEHPRSSLVTFAVRVETVHTCHQDATCPWPGYIFGNIGNHFWRCWQSPCNDTVQKCPCREHVLNSTRCSQFHRNQWRTVSLRQHFALFICIFFFYIYIVVWFNYSFFFVFWFIDVAIFFVLVCLLILNRYLICLDTPTLPSHWPRYTWKICQLSIIEYEWLVFC